MNIMLKYIVKNKLRVSKKDEKMVSKYFKRKEFACKCGCGFSAVDAELLAVLEDLRIYFLNPLVINSGCRCETHNKKIGGANKSYHIRGMAADIRIKNISTADISAYLEKKYHNKYGIGKHKTFIHIDVRQNSWRKLY